MIAFREKLFSEIKDRLNGVRTIGILSCGFCPALQKKGGTIGIERWKGLLEKDFAVKWTMTGPALCDERLYRIHLDEMGNKLDEVDIVLVMACDAGFHFALGLLGYECVACLESLYFGILRSDGTVERIGSMEKEGAT